MNSQRSIKLVFLGALALMMVECSFLGSSPSFTFPGLPLLATPIKFVIPDGLAATASVENIDGVTEQTGPSWEIAPAHIDITLHNYALQRTFLVAQIVVYHASEYAAANPRAAESMKRLQSILADPNKQYSNDVLPYLPFFNAGQVFATQEKVVHFRGGSGFRTVTKYAQDVSPIDNSSLFYHFQGLSDDGSTYIIALLPTTAPFLAVDNNPDSPIPSGGIAFPQNSAPGSSFETYFYQISDLLNKTPAAKFNPSLEVLDNLVQSISITQ